jgi:HPt (histidine-containing phosphotransfer) domain-containing protein
MATLAGVLDQERLKELDELGGESLVLELVQVFRNDLPVQCAALRRAVDAGDARSVQMVAHTMKGGSRNIGATQLAAYCQSLEHSAKTGNLAGASDMITSIENEVSRVQQVFDTIIQHTTVHLDHENPNR